MKVIASLTLAVALSACAATPPSSPLPKSGAALTVNPASMNCLQNHGTLQTVQTPQGEQTYCLLPGGKRCEEWDMFRGNCPTRTVNVNMKKFGL